MKKISIIVPMYYEEEVVGECYKRLTEVMNNIFYDYELIFVNDGSEDNTLPQLESIALKDKKVKVISFSRNFGHQAAVLAGIDHADGDAVVIIDADLQDPPELIPEMIHLWEKGYHVVYAKRKKRLGETFLKRMTAKIFYRCLNSLSSVTIPVDTGDFRLMDIKVVNELRDLSEHNPFIRGLVSWIGFKQRAIEYERDKRFAGETKYPLKKMLKLAADGMVAFSHKPLKLILYLGLLTFSLSVVLFAYTVVAIIVGWPISMAFWLLNALTFWSSIMLIALGVMAQYIIRIYDEVRNRPRYIIENNMNIDEVNSTEYYKDFDKKSS